MSFIFKIFDQAKDHFFELTVHVVKNKILNEIDERLLSPYEIRVLFSIPSLARNEYVDITQIVYKEIKKHDIYNYSQLGTGYQYEDQYIAEAIELPYEPLQFKKYLINEGFKSRFGLVDCDKHEYLDEYTSEFKDIKYLDTFVDSFKNLLKDSSFLPLTESVLFDQK